VEDHVIGYQIHEDLWADGDRVVAAVLFLRHSFEPLETLAAIDSETVDLVAEFRAVADEGLCRVPVRELRQHCGQLRVDRRAVVALHEVLDDELPVRLDVIGDPSADLELGEPVALDRLRVSEPFGDRAPHRVLKGRPGFPETDPGVAQPLP
jgi:hypothetical protein